MKWPNYIDLQPTVHMFKGTDGCHKLLELTPEMNEELRESQMSANCLCQHLLVTDVVQQSTYKLTHASQLQFTQRDGHGVPCTIVFSCTRLFTPHGSP